MRSESRSWWGALLAVLAVVVAAVLGAGLSLGAGAAAQEGPGCDPSTSPSSTASTTASADPSDDPSADPSDDAGTDDETGDDTGEEACDDPEGDGSAQEIADASLRWGINNESNNSAFFGLNFFSAGKIPNPGKGGQTLAEKDWKQSVGSVSIEKYSKAAGKYVAATWAGLQTDPSGTPLGPPGLDRFSNHQVVLVGGKGTVDPVEGDAVIRWSGSFTVLYYSGLTFFYVTDPVLTVSHGQAVLTATLSGYASSREDSSRWERVDPRTVTLADLGAVSLDDDLGFTAQPAYLGVPYAAPAGATPQTAKTAQNEAYWGAFPQSFVDYQTDAGAGPYWYASGGATDTFKVPLPLTVSYEARRPAAVPTPQTSTHVEPVRNVIKSPPKPSPTPTPTTRPAVPVAVPVVPVAPPVAQPPAAGQAVLVAAARPVETTLALRAASAEPAGSTWPWWAGSAALLAAALVALASFAPLRLWSRLRPPSRP